VLRVRLEIGRFSCVTPEALRFCFDICAKDTVVEDAVLEIVAIPGRARCRGCGDVFDIASFSERCACGETDLSVVSGEELILKEMEIA
jgi:hydrogenase nickel incorporation protein HypA/HybF